MSDQTEAQIQADIRLGTGLLPHVRLFRNNRGVAWMGKVIKKAGMVIMLERGDVLIKNARSVEFGLTDGASDLIGLTQVVVTPDMVGQTLAVFTAAEVKRPGESVPTHQQNFVDFVRRFGGIAGVVRSREDGVRLVARQ